jgi:hypothetical protein
MAPTVKRHNASVAANTTTRQRPEFEKKSNRTLLNLAILFSHCTTFTFQVLYQNSSYQHNTEKTFSSFSFRKFFLQAISYP